MDYTGDLKVGTIQCPECGYFHPQLKPGEKCSFAETLVANKKDLSVESSGRNDIPKQLSLFPELDDDDISKFLKRIESLLRSKKSISKDQLEAIYNFVDKAII